MSAPLKLVPESSEPSPGTRQHPMPPGHETGITPSLRAAVIIAMLGDSAAKPIVEKLDDQALAKVAAALENISILAQTELVEIVVDFLTHLRQSAGALRGSREMAHEIISSVLEPGRLSAVLGQVATSEEMPEDNGDVWSRLESKDPLQIADYLGGLSNNLIALILGRMDVTIASDILCHLSEDKLRPIMGYMIETQEMDAGIETVIERMIEMEFLNAEVGSSEEDEAHLEMIGELLSLIPSDKRDSLIAFLKEQHTAQLEGIEKSIFTIEALPDLLPRKAVPVVFRELEMAVLVKLLGSLRDTHAPVAEYLFDNISSRLADQIRDDLGDFTPLPPVEAEGLQRQFLTDLMSLKRRDMIIFEKPSPSEE